eukprot:103055_1
MNTKLNVLFIDDIWSKTSEYLSIVDYVKSAAISKYHYRFLSKNKQLVFKLIQNEWNQIFFVFPHIKNMITDIKDAKTMHNFLHQLENDFLSVIRKTPANKLNQMTPDQYIIDTLNAILKSSTYKFDCYSKKIAKIKNIPRNNLRIFKITIQNQDPIWKIWDGSLNTVSDGLKKMGLQMFDQIMGRWEMRDYSIESYAMHFWAS